MKKFLRVLLVVCLAVLCLVAISSCSPDPADTTTAPVTTTEVTTTAPSISFATLKPDEEGNAALILPNATTEFSFRDEITVADGVSYTVSQDKYGQSTYTSKIVPLSEGDNVFYILVEEGDELTIYTFTIRRRATHTVTFDRADGSPIIMQQVEEGDTAVIPDVENPEEFLGWDNDATAPITSDVTFTALWREHTITYELGGAENISFHPTTYTVNDAFILWDLNRSGYKFLGWTLDGETVTGIPKGTTGDLTLVANWEIETYSISYHLGGGTNAAENPTTYTVKDTIVLANPTRTGYKFLGWMFGGEYVTEIPAGRVGNIGIIANWEAIAYTITYDLAGGTNDAENPATYTVNDTIALANSTRNGYKFLGWTLDGETITEIPAGSIGDITLVANWSPTFNPITEVKKMKSGNIRLTHADGTTTTVEASLPMRDGYNSVYYTNYSFDADTATLTLELADQSYENIANRHLGTAATVTVCLREESGKLVWRYEADTEWKPLCNAGKDADPLTALVSATEIGKVTIPTDGKVALTVNGNALRFRAMDWKEGTDFVMDCTLGASSNKQFNISYYREVSSTTPLSSTTGGATWKFTGDDITPINIQGTYIGANHGYYIIAAIPNPTGANKKTEADIGSVWRVGNQEYVLVRAGATAKEDSHATEYLWFCPISDAMMASGSFSYVAIAQGAEIKHVSGATNTRTVTASASSCQIQFYNAINHVTERAFLNGTVEIDLTKNAIYTAEYIDFYESYDIIYLPAMLEYLMENVGYNDNMSHCSDEIAESYVTFHNTYRFHKNGATVVYSSYDFHKTVTCSYIGGVQSGAFPGSDHYIYVPGANNEYKTPTLQGTSTVNFGRDHLADSDTLFTSYFQMTSATGTKALNLGFNPDFGFGQNDVREEYIQGNDDSNLAFYYTSYKMYPRLVANCQISAGTVVDCIAYRLPSEATDEDFTAINWYWVGDDIYLSLHTTKELTDKVVTLPDYMEGMTITTTEKSASFTVGSLAVEDGSITVSTTEAGYAILKLSPAQ